MKHTKSLLIWAGVFLLVVMVIQYSTATGKTKQLSFTQFVNNSLNVDKVPATDRVRDITVRGNNIDGTLVSADAARMAALRDRLSAAVLMLLFGAAVISTCLVGRYHGARQKPHVFETVSYIVLVSFAVCVILDLNQPSRGLIRVDDWPLHRLTASMAE